MEQYLAIDNYCGWPNLTKRPDGQIIMTVYNQPVHSDWEGEVESFVSRDEGWTWSYQGTPVRHEPGKNRMNVACGNAFSGDYLALVSGWDNCQKAGLKNSLALKERNILETAVCRSQDGGKTFAVQPLAYNPPLEKSHILPFGNLVQLPDGRLLCPFLSFRHQEDPLTGKAYVLFSQDDGQSWQDARPVAQNRFNEIYVLATGENNLLAAVRTLDKGSRLELFRSTDLGQSWQPTDVLTAGGMHPAHLLLLQSGAVLLTFGIRFKGFYGLGCMLSLDQGQSWTVPRVLTEFAGATDGGYPASLELADGRILTAYYANNAAGHNRYHVGVLRWRL